MWKYNLILMMIYKPFNIIFDYIRWTLNIGKGGALHIYDILDLKADINAAYKYYYAIFKWIKCDKKRFKHFYKLYINSHYPMDAKHYPDFCILMKYKWLMYFLIYKKLNKNGLNVSFKELLKFKYEILVNKSFINNIAYEIRDDVPEHCIDEWIQWS